MPIDKNEQEVMELLSADSKAEEQDGSPQEAVEAEPQEQDGKQPDAQPSAKDGEQTAELDLSTLGLADEIEESIASAVIQEYELDPSNERDKKLLLKMVAARAAEERAKWQEGESGFSPEELKAIGIDIEEEPEPKEKPKKEAREAEARADGSDDAPVKSHKYYEEYYGLLGNKDISPEDRAEKLHRLDLVNWAYSMRTAMPHVVKAVKKDLMEGEEFAAAVAAEVDKRLEGIDLSAIKNVSQETAKKTAQARALEIVTSTPGFKDAGDLMKPVDSTMLVVRGKQVPNTPYNQILRTNPSLALIQPPDTKGMADPARRELAKQILVLKEVHKLYKLRKHSGSGNGNGKPPADRTTLNAGGSKAKAAPGPAKEKRDAADSFIESLGYNVSTGQRRLK